MHGLKAFFFGRTQYVKIASNFFSQSTMVTSGIIQDSILDQF